MQSKATTVREYLDGLPEDRRKALEAVRRVIREHIPEGYKEGMQYGMIGWFVPRSVYPKGYHCDAAQPVPFAHLASQKRHMALYLFCAYMDPAEKAWFTEAWRATGRKLDMGASCVRFKRLEDVPLEVVGEAVSRWPVERFLEVYEGATSRGRKKTTKKGAKKSAAKKAATKKKVAKKTSSRRR